MNNNNFPKRKIPIHAARNVQTRTSTVTKSNGLSKKRHWKKFGEARIICIHYQCQRGNFLLYGGYLYNSVLKLFQGIWSILVSSFMVCQYICHVEGVQEGDVPPRAQSAEEKLD